MADETDNMLPAWLDAAIRAQTRHFGTMGAWVQASGLGRTLSIELADAGVLPTVVIENRRWVDIWGGLAVLHGAAYAGEVVAVPGEARARELARKARIRAKVRAERNGG
jgi:hypothetical protein